jgi:hypothetical protein
MSSPSNTSTQSVRVHYDRPAYPGRGGTRECRAITFGEHAERWVTRQCELACAGLIRVNTVCRFESALVAHLVPFFGGVELDELDAIDRDRCDAFRTTLFVSRQLAPRTINGLFAILRLILRRATQDRVTPGPDPTLGIRPLYAVPRRVDCFSPSELDQLLQVTPRKCRGSNGVGVPCGATPR